ncbi:zinc-binding alcohol dehydrogenase family protein [Kribbella voronezhensis]|uniref:Zinc-binding alcohol dehydrogenase family protein n=1 Tax=Kribbella voronezhensis TaxID=2512212 RepID=A0A4R7SVH8_9ACTN|nr:zinc-binding dehydrogenase [Kribbella voronezhensis]TDU83320.1 zinc-binding alcohol dehydrogenase family protein [Kribbella voronezhensis]
MPDERITTIAAQVDGITPANGANAAPGAIEEIAALVAAGRLRVPIAARFPVEQIRTAVELQAARHVQGKVVVDLQKSQQSQALRSVGSVHRPVSLATAGASVSAKSAPMTK